MKNFTPTEYKLVCVATGREFDDAGWTLEDRQCSTPSMVRAVYAKRQLDVKSDDHGLYKFHDWLPIHRMLEGSAAPVTYKSEKLAARLGLENLWITFSGWNPAKGARMTTCSFKETEAYSVCARIPEDETRVLVVASAGNTARAFAKVCSENNIPLLLAVPADNLDALWFDGPLNDCVKLIATEKGSDYFDAIHLSNMVMRSKRFFAEGGAKNVARRDGMGTTFLSATTTIGAIPDFYFQAVGSGTGAIAAWEANLRLIEDGRYGSKKCRLVVSQNAPFVPMYDAWRVDSRVMLDYDDNRARRDAGIIDAKVLSNRRPPYGLVGGLYDALKDTDGDIVVATNAQGRKAAALFAETEGVDIHPAAGIAVASLEKAVADGRVPKGATMMLNITGGGERLRKTTLAASGRELWYLKPSHVFAVDAETEAIVAVAEGLFPVAEPEATVAPALADEASTAEEPAAEATVSPEEPSHRNRHAIE
ncbi:MAG: cysteate synthase [Alistipes sp.]|jgi:cysteate synthase|nr:cysteate synthase [Alistipes sp.]